MEKLQKKRIIINQRVLNSFTFFKITLTLFNIQKIKILSNRVYKNIL